MKNKRLLIIILIGIAVISLAFYYVANKNSNNLNGQSNPTAQPNGQLVTSKFLKFQVNAPNKFTTQQGQAFVNLISDESKINISRNGTNADNLEDYLNDFDSKRIIEVSSEKSVIINSYPTIVRVEIFKAGPISQQKVYYIYPASWTVFTISTSSPELYNDLDQVAKSFRYTP